jgi:microcin C transport system substrate-binding protein
MIIASMFDFEYCNENLFYGQYTRQLCFWENDPELYSRGPATGDVRRILIALREKHGPDAVPADAIARGPYNVGDQLDGTPYPMHARIQAANAALDAMGWTYNPRADVRQKDGMDLRFEVLLVSPTWTRIVNPFIETLREIGIRGGYRLVQPAELLRQIQERRYDMILTNFPVSESPGNEQRDFWTTQAADIEGSRNTIGIRNPAVDEAVEQIIAAPTRRALVAAVQVLDRILCAQHYVIPNWYIPYDRGVYWNRFGHPETYVGAQRFPENVIQWWWYDEDRAQRLEEARRTGKPMDENPAPASP